LRRRPERANPASHQRALAPDGAAIAPERPIRTATAHSRRATPRRAPCRRAAAATPRVGDLYAVVPSGAWGPALGRDARGDRRH
jgi:hypothetical protein